MLTNLKNIFYSLFILLLINNCGIKGPNFNQGISHNSNLQNRNKVICREDIRCKKNMTKIRNKSIPKKIIKNKIKKKYI